MGCLGDCLEMGPPPDSILFIPPPPAPSFLHNVLPDLVVNNSICASVQHCTVWPTAHHKLPDKSGDYVELPRKDLENWSVTGIDDTWLLVLVASSIGVLLLGALLAMFLLKCREMNMFGTNDCSMHARPTKNHENRDCAGVTGTLTSSKLIHPSEAVLFHGAPIPDNRMVWAALTPHGTQHFVSENYPRDLIDYGEQEDHYETVDHWPAPRIPPPPPVTAPASHYHTFRPPPPSFDNSGFVDYDYEEPLATAAAPLIESYQLSDMDADRAQQGNTDMRCASLVGSLRRPAPMRPRISSPTRIEHPNLPPLNLHPHTKEGTFRKGQLHYRTMTAGGGGAGGGGGDGAGTLPKYGC